MAVVLGYGGLGNTNGARSFAGKEEAEIVETDTDDLIRTGLAFCQRGVDFIGGSVKDVVRRYEFAWIRL